jgi:hypothetical protein
VNQHLFYTQLELFLSQLEAPTHLLAKSFHENGTDRASHPLFDGAADSAAEAADSLRHIREVPTILRAIFHGNHSLSSMIAEPMLHRIAMVTDSLVDRGLYLVAVGMLRVMMTILKPMSGQGQALMSQGVQERLLHVLSEPRLVALR